MKIHNFVWLVLTLLILQPPCLGDPQQADTGIVANLDRLNWSATDDGQMLSIRITSPVSPDGPTVVDAELRVYAETGAGSVMLIPLKIRQDRDQQVITFRIARKPAALGQVELAFSSSRTQRQKREAVVRIFDMIELGEEATAIMIQRYEQRPGIAAPRDRDSLLYSLKSRSRIIPKRVDSRDQPVSRQ